MSLSTMDRSSPLESFGTLSIDYGERAPHPPDHDHVGPWAVFQAWDRARYTRADRDRAARVMRYLSMDPTAPRAEMLTLGRRALATVMVARVLGHHPDDVTLFLRVLYDHQARHEGTTARGYV